ncbi:hypothetical protein [Pararcticibacter amylolyticus]|nr:hypothetical protein [Pararcticibacter amylolyticus]
MINVLTAVVLLLNFGYQNVGQSGYKVYPAKLVWPKFTDQAGFTKFWSHDEGVKELYRKLRDDDDYQVYNYGFEISKDGKIYGESWNDESLLLNIINYFKKTSWTPAYRPGCFKCKERVYGMLEISVVPNKKIIKLRIDVGDGVLRGGLKTVSIYTREKKIEE